MKSPCVQGFAVFFRALGPGSPPDILARTGYGHRMAPVRVRGCVGVPVFLGRPGHSSGKPMPGAGETAHVRRLFVDRSRCALEVSPAPRRVPMSLTTGRRAVVADKSGDTLSRRMWGRRPGRPDGWHPIGGLAIGRAPGEPLACRFSPGRDESPFPQFRATRDHVRGTGDDRVPGGYTHFQPRRDPRRTGSPAEGG